VENSTENNEPAESLTTESNKTTKHTRINSTKYQASGAGMMASLDVCRKWGECTKSCARR
jgi:hypothetical protein